MISLSSLRRHIDGSVVMLLAKKTTGKQPVPPSQTREFIQEARFTMASLHR
jgi:hypothetical protein